MTGTIKKKSRNFIKRAVTFILSLTITIMLAVPSVPVYATGAEFIGIGVTEAVSSGAMSAGMSAGGGVGVGSIVGFGLDFISALTSSGKKGDINTYYYQGGDTYNTTVNYKVFNDYTKNIDVSQEYNYSFYNPVTNNYNYTNDYSYNPSYNTYFYTTNAGDTNTEYYITDNTTNISYYIISTNETTGEKFESYYEIYYELPDGRNSYNLKKEDIWGQYFIYDYAKYESVAEDDGTTLGLWHLDGDLKDSSYWGNSAGASYSSTYKDARFEGGKYLGTSFSDYFTLPLDQVSLPSSYTLEWIQYVPSKYTNSQTITDRREFLNEELSYHPMYDPPKTIAGTYLPATSSPGLKTAYYNKYETEKHYKHTGVSGFSDTSILCEPHTDCLEHYAIVKNGETYTYYVNGVKTNCTDEHFSGGGVVIRDSVIRFYVGTRINGSSDYVSQGKKYAGIIIGSYPTSENFTDSNYSVYEYDYVFSKTQYITVFNQDTIIDEVRLSKGAIYTKDFTPSSQPFTTNTVLIAPENPVENEVGFMTSYSLGNVRVGGARPTYPSSGDIFVNLTDDKVDSVQQYQENGWYEITGTIYKNGKWNDLKGYDMSEYTVNDPDLDPDNPDKPNPDNPDKPIPDDPNDDGSIWSKIGKLLSSLLGIIEKLIGPLVDGIISLINMIMDAIASLAGFSSGFSNFLRVTFVFIPDEILSIIGLGLMLTIFASIIKIFL